MKNLSALIVLALSVGVANAGSALPPTVAQSHASKAKGHRLSHPAPPLVIDDSAPRDVFAADGVTVTGKRTFDFHGSQSFVTFRDAQPRDLSAPPAVGVVSGPVQLTVGTGNTEDLRVQHVEFPFERSQDRTVRESDVLKVWVTRFKID